jgi:aspartate/methionine/tyrosine aminotransferase
MNRRHLGSDEIVVRIVHVAKAERDSGVRWLKFDPLYAPLRTDPRYPLMLKKLGLPKAGLDKFLPVDGAFYLYADVSRFSDDSFDFAKRMLNEADVAATPGIDFDPVNGRHFLRFCYAGSAAEMREAVERIGNWLSKFR